MLFHTLSFSLFFIFVFCLYWLFNQRWQNLLLLAASYFFYAWWNIKLAPLMAASTLIDYFCGLGIAGTTNKARQKILVVFSVCGNLALLGFFKYYGFFAESLNALLHSAGLGLPLPILNIVLPIGISFYTFQSMSYSIDVYRGKTNACANLPDFALYVSFFPQLIAGPIERSRRLLPQIQSKRVFSFEQLSEGCFLIFWGVFKKILIADNLARIVDQTFGTAAGPETDLWAALYAFAFQIYCDFSAYSDIARGLAKCLGIELVVNFNLPYFARNPRQFWRRWHISLSEWLRDYLYISLGGSRAGRFKTYFNLMITMLLGGLWHGANWTFVLWGGMHGLLLTGHRLYREWVPEQSNSNKMWQGLKNAVCVFVFFHVVCLTWLLFRAESLSQVIVLLPLLAQWPTTAGLMGILEFTWVLLVVQFVQYLKKDFLAVLKLPHWARVPAYTIMFYLFLIYGAFEGREFIYFQF